MAYSLSVCSVIGKAGMERGGGGKKGGSEEGKKPVEEKLKERERSSRFPTQKGFQEAI